MSVDTAVARSPFARLRSGATFAAALLGAVCGPALYLWPWLLGVVVFATFARSPQGIVLAERYRDDPFRLTDVVACLGACWVAVAVASMLALMAAAVRAQRDSTVPDGSTVGILARGVWVVSLASAYGVLFAQSVQLTAAWVAVAALTLLGAIGIAWMTRSALDERSAVRRIYESLQRHRAVVIAFASLLAFGPLLLGAFASIKIPLRLADLGPLLVAMVGMSAVSTLLGILVVVVPLYVGRPWIGAVFVVAMAAWTTGHRAAVDLDNPLLREYHKTSLPDASTFQMRGNCGKPSFTLEESLRRHAEDVGRSMSATEIGRHLYLVSAEGGGIRAAYWTAITLAELDIATRGSFGESAASLSGVSGGSLGIATWLAARDREDLNAQERLQLITEFLGSDFLSPALGGLLFLDVPRLIMGPLWPRARRDHVFEKALADRWRDVARSDFFARPMVNGCVSGFELAPAVFFNATDALTGGYVALTNTQLPWKPLRWNEAPDPSPRRVSWRDPQLLQNTSLVRATWAQIVSISARFPYIAPEAHVGIDASVLADDQAAAERQGRGTESVEQSVDRRIKAYAARLAHLDAETLWSRVWVLVDGGYFDNSALTPTRDAIAIIDAQREKEAKAIPNVPKPFTETTVHVVHISNDPGEPCLPVPDGWRERLSARVRAFLDKSGQLISCASDVPRLEASMQQRALYSFLAPVDALLGVRTEHSRGAVAQLEAAIAARGTGYVLEMRDLGTAFAAAFGIGRKQRARSEEEIVKGSIQRVQRADQYAASTKALVNQQVGRPVTEEAVNTYLRALFEWQEMVRDEARQVDCHKRFSPVGPPLGWTLSKSNQELMRCLSLRERTVGGILGRVLEPPYLPWLGEYTTSEARFRMLRERERSKWR
jgi:hypothetical protein